MSDSSTYGSFVIEELSDEYGDLQFAEYKKLLADASKHGLDEEDDLENTKGRSVNKSKMKKTIQNHNPDLIDENAEYKDFIPANDKTPNMTKELIANAIQTLIDLDSKGKYGEGIDPTKPLLIKEKAQTQPNGTTVYTSGIQLPGMPHALMQKVKQLLIGQYTVAANIPEQYEKVKIKIIDNTPGSTIRFLSSQSINGKQLQILELASSKPNARRLFPGLVRIPLSNIQLSACIKQKEDFIRIIREACKFKNTDNLNYINFVENTDHVEAVDLILVTPKYYPQKASKDCHLQIQQTFAYASTKIKVSDTLRKSFGVLIAMSLTDVKPSDNDKAISEIQQIVKDNVDYGRLKVKEMKITLDYDKNTQTTKIEVLFPALYTMGKDWIPTQKKIVEKISRLEKIFKSCPTKTRRKTKKKANVNDELSDDFTIDEFSDQLTSEEGDGDAANDQNCSTSESELSSTMTVPNLQNPLRKKGKKGSKDSKK